eukprot:980073-Pyramimonas_sp.AAC.2
MTLKAGTGSKNRVLPTIPAMYRYRGNAHSTAAALHTAMETERMVFAPSLLRFPVPSSICVMMSSISSW